MPEQASQVFSEEKKHTKQLIRINGTKISLKCSTSEEAKKLSYRITGGSLGTLKVLRGTV